MQIVTVGSGYKCLEVGEGAGGSLYLADCKEGYDSQGFGFVAHSDGFQVVLKHSHMCLDVDRLGT